MNDVSLEEPDEFQIDLAEGVEDDSDKEINPFFTFNITFFGADYPVETIVQRMDRGDFYVPPFQRSFVWSQKQSSRFIESLLYGLPVPGIFLYREPKTQKHLIIDGQQRLKTLQFFMQGTFGEKRFRLLDVAEPWKGKGFAELEDADKRRLTDAVIHATVFKQEEPREDDQSIYYVFERINTGGIRLSGQEIRTCLYYGKFVALLRTLNLNERWRSVYGAESKRLKDSELILRFFAFLYHRQDYSRPMSGFLNDAMRTYREVEGAEAERLSSAFLGTIDAAVRLFGERPLRPERVLNAAVFDSVMVGLAERLAKGPITDEAAARNRYTALLQNAEFEAAYRRATADEDSVKKRFRLAIEAFADVA